MKKRIPAFIVLFALSFTLVFGQKDSLSPKTFFAVKTDLVFLVPAISAVTYSKGYLGRLSFEQGFSHRHSFQLTGEAYKYGSINPTQSWKIIPEYKFFLNKRKHFKGFYAGAFLKYVNQVFTSYLPRDDSFKEKFNIYGAGLTFGYQTYIKKHLTLDILLGFGGRYITYSAVLPANIGQPNPGGFNYPVIGVIDKYPYLGIDGRFSINLGYKF